LISRDFAKRPGRSVRRALLFLGIELHRYEHTNEHTTILEEEICGHESPATDVLIAGRHSCRVCQRPDVQIHHIDGNPPSHRGVAQIGAAQ
jgi:hypothetical protein